MFKINIEYARTMSMTTFWCFYCYLLTYVFYTFSSVSVVDFELVNVNWVKTIRKKKN